MSCTEELLEICRFPIAVLQGVVSEVLLAANDMYRGSCAGARGHMRVALRWLGEARKSVSIAPFVRDLERDLRELESAAKACDLSKWGDVYSRAIGRLWDALYEATASCVCGKPLRLPAFKPTTGFYPVSRT
jgi:hypothetical protein